MAWIPPGVAWAGAAVSWWFYVLARRAEIRTERLKAEIEAAA